LHGAHDEWQADECQRDEDADFRERDFDAFGKKKVCAFGIDELPHPPFLGIDRGERDAGDGGGQCERQVNERVDDTASVK
jgi:hypothetical protein